jgi:hypothetical protein
MTGMSKSINISTYSKTLQRGIISVLLFIGVGYNGTVIKPIDKMCMKTFTIECYKNSNSGIGTEG